jgi:hypothetical protein
LAVEVGMTASLPRLSTLAVLGALALTACAKNHSADSAQPQTKAAPADKAIAPPENRKIIRTGSLRITIDSYDEARAKLDVLLQQVGGYVDSTQVSRGRDAITDATIVVRIPSQGFGDVVTRFRELGEIASESTNAEDITAQYVDIDARLAAARTLEARLLQLATERNGSVDSVLAVERELARVRGEIEGYEGHLRQWNDQVAMSTLTVVLSTKTPEIVVSGSFTGRLSNAFHDSIQGMRELGGWFVVILAALLPWLLILGPVALVVRRLNRSGYLRKLRAKL